MKTSFNKIVLAFAIILGCLIFTPSQGQGPPDPLSGSGTPTTVKSGSSPIQDEGCILILLVACYGFTKYYRLRKSVVD